VVLPAALRPGPATVNRQPVSASLGSGTHAVRERSGRGALCFTTPFVGSYLVHTLVPGMVCPRPLTCVCHVVVGHVHVS